MHRSVAPLATTILYRRRLVASGMRAVHPQERAEMASVFMTYREAGQLVPHGVFAMLLSVFALPVVFVASGVSMVFLTYMTRYIPRRY